MKLTNGKLIGKINFLLIAVLVFGFKVQAQKISVANGNWTNPAIWFPLGVPQNLDTVTINHNVIVDTNVSVQSAKLTVNIGASLMEDLAPRTMDLNSSVLINKGIIVVSYLDCFSDTVSNYDSIHVKKILKLQECASQNNGNIYVADSLKNRLGDFTNTNSSVVTTDNFIYNDGLITNNGIIITKNLHNDNTFVNNDSVLVTKNWMENGKFTNNANAHIIDTLHIESNASLENYIVVTTDNFVWIEGIVDNSGTFTVPTIQIDALGVLNNRPNGIVVTTDNFIFNNGTINTYNNSIIWVKNIISTGTIKGAYGCIFVSDSSNVSGDIIGTLDFCDVTSLESKPIDILTGTVSSFVTFCTQNCSAVGINDQLEQAITVIVYPNPVTDFVTLSMAVIEKGAYLVELYDIIGQKVFEQTVEIISMDNQFKISCNDLQQGTYLLSVRNRNATYKTLLLKMK